MATSSTTTPYKVPDHSVAFKWSLVLDLDRCTGCEACIIACQSENNLPINTQSVFEQGRAYEWIRLERYWDGEWPNVKARFIPILCQHCENAPCEPVCPVYATYHNNEGLNVQVYNRCVGTRYCGNNCPYHARIFNWWEPTWPEDLRNQLNPDVTVRSRGVMEKCSMCIQRIRRAVRSKTPAQVPDGSFMTACAQACPTSAITFGNLNDPNSKVAQIRNTERHFRVHENLGTEPSVVYLMKVEI